MTISKELIFLLKGTAAEHLLEYTLSKCDTGSPSNSLYAKITKFQPISSELCICTERIFECFTIVCRDFLSLFLSLGYCRLLAVNQSTTRIVRG